MSLWIFTLFGLLALSLAFRGRLEIKISAIREAKGSVPYSLLSAVNIAKMKLKADEETSADSPYDKWYGEGAEDKKGTAALNGLGDPARKLTYFLYIDDEESRLNINTVPAQVLEKFFELLKPELLQKAEGKKLLSDTEDLIGGILYWRGGSWHKKGEKTAAFYKKKPFESLEELFLVPGVKEEDIPILKSYFTVFPRAQENVPFTINLNTVSKPILKAVIQSIPGNSDSQDRIYEQIIAFREGRLQRYESDLKESEKKEGAPPRLGWQEGGGLGDIGRRQTPFGFFSRKGLPGGAASGKKQESPEKSGPQKIEAKKYFVESDLNVMNLIYLLRLPPFADLVAGMIQLLPYLTVDSKYFRVRAKVSGEVLKDFGAEVILGSDQEILAWQRI